MDSALPLPGSAARALVEAVRPSHWVKNAAAWMAMVIGVLLWGRDLAGLLGGAQA